jgi:hypothetical protein
MIEKLTTDSDHNYIKENQFQENLFLLLKFLNLYYKCLRAYVHESFCHLLQMSAVIPTELYFTERSPQRNRPKGIALKESPQRNRPPHFRFLNL